MTTNTLHNAADFKMASLSRLLTTFHKFQQMANSFDPCRARMLPWYFSFLYAPAYFSSNNNFAFVVRKKVAT